MTRALAKNNATKHQMVTITLPILVDVLGRTEGTRPHLLDSQLSRKDEGLALLALFEGMRAANSEISNTSGNRRPVASYADVARYIMQTICDTLSPEAESDCVAEPSGEAPVVEEPIETVTDGLEPPPIRPRKKYG